MVYAYKERMEIMNVHVQTCTEIFLYVKMMKLIVILHVNLKENVLWQVGIINLSIFLVKYLIKG